MISISITLPPNPDIIDIIEATRLHQAKQLGWSPISGVSTVDDRLQGACVENANTLATAINEETEYTAKIIKGGLDYYGEPTPETYEQAENNGTIHHWVEITTDSETYICNLFSEALEEYQAYPDEGPLVTQALPQNYIKFD